MSRWIVIVLLACGSAQAKDKKKYLGPIEQPPGGGRADHYMYDKWENSVRHQGFPQLPHASKLIKDWDKLPPVPERQRYIMQIATDAVDLKNEIYDKGFFYFAYSNKEQGDLLIMVHPKFRLCFDDLRKKFDFMQAVVIEYGELVGRKQVAIEGLRQCWGDFKYTGSKLPGAKGLEN